MTNATTLCSLMCACLAAAAMAQDPVAPKPNDPARPDAKPTLSVPDFANATCPIMGKPVSKSLYAETSSGRIYVCCKACIKKVQKDVAKAWKTAYPIVKETANTTCPVTGKAVDAKVPRVMLQGFSVAVCCPECEPKAKEHSQVVLAKASDAKLVDLENRACPITAEEADANTIAVIDGQIVRFATRKARTEAQKDPAAVLAKAKEIVTQQTAGTLKLVPHPAKQEADDEDDAPAPDAPDAPDAKKDGA